MPSDLLHPIAAVDWAITQFPMLEKRIDAWVECRPYSLIREFDPQRGKDAIKISHDIAPPLLINAEVGAMINSVRSSLDLLATALAARNGHLTPKDVYFPICDSRERFLDTRRGGGFEKIKRLSDTDKAIIKNLKPYKGGNDLLYALHQMDIARKHRSLIDVHVDMSRMTLSGIGINAEFPDGWASFKDQSVLVWISSDAPNYEFDITVEVTVREFPQIARKPVLATLNNFVSLAQSIINLFA